MLPLLVPSSAEDCAAARLSSWRATAGGRRPRRSRLQLRGSGGGKSTAATLLRREPSSVSSRRGRAADWAAIGGRHADAAVVPVVVPGIDVVHNLLLILVLVPSSTSITSIPPPFASVAAYAVASATAAPLSQMSLARASRRCFE